MLNLDQYFLVNLGMDALLLGVLARVRLGRPTWRIAAGAAAGAAYATLAALPGLTALTGPLGEISAALLMVFIVLGRQGWRRLLLETGLLLLLAAGLAGLALLVGAISHARGQLGDWASLGVASALFVAAGEAYARRQRTSRASGQVVVLEVLWQGRRASLQAFVDSGCRVRDPITGLPVVIAEIAAMRALLPARLATALGRPEPMAGEEVAAAAADDDRIASSLRLVQLRTVVSEGEWLYGLRASTRVAGGPARAAVVCLTPRRLSAGGRFSALLPPEICAIGEEVVS